eukprot:Phypoly_transcript_11892.p1 GENE.Phypoly_transcript_11892~~Phypoly_transcript_11892.p1  ORF type:complete len:207 (-),score=35.60 Phypoly_transcript_11892:356-976(-)
MFILLLSWLQNFCKIIYHKYCIFTAGLYITKKVSPAGSGLRVTWKRMALHDLSKFTPSEFFAYAAHFHGKHKGKPGDHDFDVAWKHHYEHNDHHPEYFQKNGVVGQMGPDALMELVADWFAAERAYDGQWPTPGEWKWVQSRFPKITLHEKDKLLLGAILTVLGFGNDVTPTFTWDTARLALKADTTGTRRHVDALHDLYMSQKRE